MTTEINKPPTPLAKQLAKYVVGFGVAFVVGLAPYLGVVNVPGFTALLTVFPTSIRNTMIPLSAFLMGLVAVVVQWYGTDKPGHAWLARKFKRTVAIALGSLALLVVTHVLTVVRVHLDGGREAVSFVVGFVRPASCGCSPQLSDADCIKNVTLDEAAIASCWGDKVVGTAKILLIFLYLLTTGSFVWLVGLLLLRMRAEVEAKR